MSFPEKKSYNPHVNIEYVDDKGRELTPKEVLIYMYFDTQQFLDLSHAQLTNQVAELQVVYSP